MRLKGWVVVVVVCLCQVGMEGQVLVGLMRQAGQVQEEEVRFLVWLEMIKPSKEPEG